MLDNPKSAIFTFAWASRRRFSGLRSLDYITKKTITKVFFGKKDNSFILDSQKLFKKVSLIKTVEARICRGHSGKYVFSRKADKFSTFCKMHSSGILQSPNQGTFEAQFLT